MINCLIEKLCQKIDTHEYDGLPLLFSLLLLLFRVLKIFNPFLFIPLHFHSALKINMFMIIIPLCYTKCIYVKLKNYHCAAKYWCDYLQTEIECETIVLEWIEIKSKCYKNLYKHFLNTPNSMWKNHLLIFSVLDDSIEGWSVLSAFEWINVD